MFASGWTSGWKNEYAVALMELAVETATFYPVALGCGRLLPKDKTKKEHEEHLKDMVVVEALDLLLRLTCFVLAQKFPSIKGCLTGAGSVFLDVVFLVLASKSHQLAEIISLSGRSIKACCKARFGHPGIISLGLLSGPVAV